MNADGLKDHSQRQREQKPQGTKNFGPNSDRTCLSIYLTLKGNLIKTTNTTIASAMLGPLSISNQQRGGIIMALFLFTRNVAAFAPGAATRYISQAAARTAAPAVSSLVGKKFMSSVSSDLSPDQVADIELKIKNKGDEIRQLKADGIEKADLAPHVQELLALKAQIAPPEEKKEEKEKPKKKQKQQKKKQPPRKKEEDMSESELRQARLAKVEAMKEAGAEPYAYTYAPTHSSEELQALYEGKLEGGEEDEDADVAVAGRIMAKRVFGKLAFFTLQDEYGTIQLHLEKNRLGDSFKVSKNMRIVQISTVCVELSHSFVPLYVSYHLYQNSYRTSKHGLIQVIL